MLFQHFVFFNKFLSQPRYFLNISFHNDTAKYEWMFRENKRFSNLYKWDSTSTFKACASSNSIKFYLLLKMTINPRVKTHISLSALQHVSAGGTEHQHTQTKAPYSMLPPTRQLWVWLTATHMHSDTRTCSAGNQTSGKSRDSWENWF